MELCYRKNMGSTAFGHGVHSNQGSLCLVMQVIKLERVRGSSLQSERASFVV